MSDIYRSNRFTGPALILTRFARALSGVLVLAIATHVILFLPDATVRAQDDPQSHRLLSRGGNGLADLQSQAQLLMSLRQLTERAGQNPGANPGVMDPRVQQALQQMLTQQLLESMQPSSEPGTGSMNPDNPFGTGEFGSIDPTDPNFQAMLKRMSESTGLPLNEMIQQRMEANRNGTPPTGPGAGPRPRPGQTPDTGESQEIPRGLLEQILSGQFGSNPDSTPNGQSGRRGTPGQSGDDPASRERRAAEIREMLARLGMNSDAIPGGPGTSPANPGAGRTPRRGPDGRIIPDSQPGTGPGDFNGLSDLDHERWERLRQRQAERSGSPQTPGSRQRPPESQRGPMPQEQDQEPEPDVWEKLGRIAQRAQNRSTNLNDDNAAAGSDGVRSAFARAIEETAIDLAGRTDEFLQNRQRSRRRAEPSDSDLFTSIGRATNSANDWVVGVSNTGNPGRAASVAGSGSGGSYPLIALVLTSLILTTCISMYRNRDALSRQSALAGLPEIPRHVRGRGDVVQAFHAIAARCPEALHDWWTHRRAAAVLARVSPDKSEAVATLAGLYEAARYLPADREFTEQQLESARHALKRFGES